MNEIPRQTKLPARVALEVVLQGIRIRFGRSVVTVSGVVLGVAFLMSILAGIILKNSVAAEDALRAEVQRMSNFLQAEAGALPEKTFGVLPVGSLSSAENRFLRQLKKTRGVTIQVFDPQAFLTPAETELLNEAGLDSLGDGVSALLIMGEGQPPGVDFADLMAEARQKVVATTSPAIPLPDAPGVTSTPLSRSLKEAELEARAEKAKRDRFRDIWIIIISLLVTVIGISNAMLMSVTERFREIGTMKCLGALSSIVRRMFLFESAIMGSVGGAIGAVGGLLFSIVAYTFTYGPTLVFSGLTQSFLTLLGYGLVTIVAGIILSVLAALYPANVAAKMVPAVALRSNI